MPQRKKTNSNEMRMLASKDGVDAILRAASKLRNAAVEDVTRLTKHMGGLIKKARDTDDQATKHAADAATAAARKATEHLKAITLNLAGIASLVSVLDKLLTVGLGASSTATDGFIGSSSLAQAIEAILKFSPDTGIDSVAFMLCFSMAQKEISEQLSIIKGLSEAIAHEVSKIPTHDLTVDLPAASCASSVSMAVEAAAAIDTQPKEKEAGDVLLAAPEDCGVPFSHPIGAPHDYDGGVGSSAAGGAGGAFMGSAGNNTSADAWPTL
jgi:hypothetical protein